MTQQRGSELLDKINVIREDMQARPDGDCRDAVYDLCEIVAELLLHLRNAENARIRALASISTSENP